MTLGIIAFVFGIIWIFGAFVFHVGAWIHLVLLVAAILTFIRMSKNPVR